jgi:hypothetical protein
MLNVLQAHHYIFLHVAKLKILKQASPMDMNFFGGSTCPKIKALKGWFHERMGCFSGWLFDLKKRRRKVVIF